MRFDTSQQMKLGQQMKLARRMIQSMEILQMPLAQLEERIEQELENNVTLELAEPGAEREDAPPEPAVASTEPDERPLDVGESGKDDFERLERFEETHPDAAENQYSAAGIERFESYEPAHRGRLDGERDGKLDAMAAAPARTPSLAEQLTDQWRLADPDDELRPLGELIISFLDEDGYLRTPLEVIADRAPGDMPRPTVEDLEFALTALQQNLEPPGVAARDARECLLLQIDALASSGTARDEALDIARWLVEDHLDDLMQNRLPKIAQETGLSIDEIKSGIERIQKLSLAPARQLVSDAPPTIIPDAIIEYDEQNDRYVPYLNDRNTPALRINREYAMMARDKSVPKPDRDFIRTGISNAQWLIDAVQQRRATLLRVLNVIVDRQRDFFDYGPQALKPLPMTEVADQLGIHVATVSRAVADKWVQTPRGMVALRRFFSGGLPTEGGAEVSYDAVRAALKEIIDAEDRTRPLSDEALVKELKSRGIEIARRTIAKYRDQLGIPPARLRKSF